MTPDGWELLTGSHPCPYKGVAVELAALTRCPLPVPHPFPNTPRAISQLAALVTTRREGSPLVDAPRHAVQVALTPAAAAALLRTLDGATLPEEVARVATGLRDAAVHALAEA